jgi:Flp pilus assembly protein TadD
VLHAQGRLPEAEKAYAEALRIQHWPTAAANLAALQFDQKRYADAVQILERAVADGTRNYRTWHSLASARFWAGQRDAASDAYRNAAALAEEQRRVDPRDPLLVAYLADCHAMLGDTATARRLAAEAVSSSRDAHAVAAVVAGVYEELGDRDAALRSLAAALGAGHPADRVVADPTFDKLRRDPRWTKLAAGTSGKSKED